MARKRTTKRKSTTKRRQTKKIVGYTKVGDKYALAYRSGRSKPVAGRKTFKTKTALKKYASKLPASKFKL